MKLRFLIILVSFFGAISLSLFLIGCKESSEKIKCSNFEDGLIRDTCYRDLNMKKFFIIDYQEKNCHFIDNSYLQYMCLRKGFRPHMIEFMTNKNSKIDFTNFLKECKGYDKYHALFCTYLQATKFAVDDFNKAKEICNKIKDKKLKGECSFYIATAYVININEDSNEIVDFLMDFCSEIENFPWKSECYYLVADELSLKNDLRYIQDINKACTESYITKDFSCFNHVTFFMEIETIKIFCGDVNKMGKDQCYVGLGQNIALKFIKNISLAIEKYKEVPSEFLDEYFYGMGDSIGHYSNENVIKKIELCNDVPIDYKEDCLEGSSYSTGLYHKGNIETGIEKCNEFPAGYNESCFLGLGDSIGLSFYFNFSLGIEECNKAPNQIKKGCLNGLGDSIGLEDDFILAIKKCNMFPRELRESCFSGVGQFIYLSENISVGIQKCSKAPTEYKDDCFKGLGSFLSQHFYYNLSKGVEKCNLINSDYRDDCLKGIEEGKII